ncbi:MAG: hypothetical protein OXH15_19445 [Gammaproteobacteria bacterium]|nr:hypothetical protein [Gammaproteobacteria bacterium]
MAGVLLSGPAGAGKSQLARQLLAQLEGPAVAADFQSIVVALLLLERAGDGRYPVRPDWILPLAEYVRRAVVTGAVNRDMSVVLTNSDGDPERRRFLLDLLGDGASERVFDPGRDVVAARLADAVTGQLSAQCESAIARWYARLRP